MIPYWRTVNRSEIMRKATLGIVIKDGQVLLGRKQGRPEIGEGTLNGPGGKMEPPDVTLEDCLDRELGEEVGIHPTCFEKVAIITFFWGGEAGFEVHIYVVTDFEGEPRETESMIPYWFSLSEGLPLGRMHESDRDWFPRLVAGERFNADVYYREKARGYVGIKFFPFADHD